MLLYTIVGKCADEKGTEAALLSSASAKRLVYYGYLTTSPLA